VVGAVKDRGPGAGDAAGDRRHPSSPVREGELSVRERRGAPPAGDPQLLARQPGALGELARGADRAGAGGDGALSSGASSPRGGGERRSRGAGGELGSPELSEAFTASGALYGAVVDFLSGAEAASLTHEQLEARLAADGRELLRQLFQDHLDLRARRERRVHSVFDAAGVAHGAVEADHHRVLETVVGEVTVTRLAYRAKGAENLHLQDAALNLPVERHSHGHRQLAAIEATRGSYEEAQAAIARTTGVDLAKRQVEDLTRRAAADVDAFYAEKERQPVADHDVLVLSADGKGIVMRPDALRPATMKAARAGRHKLTTRLSKGEQRNSKRMAELAVVYDATPVPRSADDVFARSDDAKKAPAPVAKAKWLTASVVARANEAFDEAERRDPKHQRSWVALVDGAKHQIDVIRAEARRRGVEVAVVCDFIHVLEYLWGAAWCFFNEGDAAAERWVAEKGLAVLSGHAGLVAGAITRKATALRLDPSRRKKADDCARYLKNKRRY
jgi:hypothetical protein